MFRKIKIIITEWPSLNKKKVKEKADMFVLKMHHLFPFIYLGSIFLKFP